MGKGNLIQGMGRGKLGDTVFYRSQGEQMFRVRNRRPKNPKSQAQMIQRSIMATVVQAYSYMSAIVDHSFESVPYGVKSMNYFNKINADKLRSLYAQDVQNTNYGADAKAHVTAPKTTALIANSYIVAKGSIENQINLTVTGNGTADAEVKIQVKGIEDGMTVAEFMNKIGLYSTESMLTRLQFVGNGTYIYEYDANATVGGKIPNLQFRYDRLVRNTTPISAEDAAKTIIINGTETSSEIKLPTLFTKYLNAENSSSELQQLIEDATQEGGTGINGTTVAIGFISSEKDGTRWKRSNCEMKFISTEIIELGLDANYGTMAWTEGTLQIGESEWYLNKGDLLQDTVKGTQKP